jgi:hypothetical protein
VDQAVFDHFGRVDDASEQQIFHLL